MVKFVVRGPIPVPMRKGARGEPYIDEGRLSNLCTTNPELTKPGCYVFACASSRGSLPIYVGQAGSEIFSEAFNHRNRNNINGYFRTRLRGSLDLYIVPQVHVKGKGSGGAISDIEEFLIAMASRRNANLINIHGTRPAKWSIAGVHNHGVGNPGTSVIAFKKMMGIATNGVKKDRNNGLDAVTQEDDVESELPGDVVLEHAIQPEQTESVDENSGDATEIDEASRPNIFLRIYYLLLYWLGMRNRSDKATTGQTG
jgi:hypothetical protein